PAPLGLPRPPGGRPAPYHRPPWVPAARPVTPPTRRTAKVRRVSVPVRVVPGAWCAWCAWGASLPAWELLAAVPPVFIRNARFCVRFARFGGAFRVRRGWCAPARPVLRDTRYYFLRQSRENARPHHRLPYRGPGPESLRARCRPAAAGIGGP